MFTSRQPTATTARSGCSPREPCFRTATGRSSLRTKSMAGCCARPAGGVGAFTGETPPGQPPALCAGLLGLRCRVAQPCSPQCSCWSVGRGNEAITRPNCSQVTAGRLSLAHQDERDRSTEATCSGRAALRRPSTGNESTGGVISDCLITGACSAWAGDPQQRMLAQLAPCRAARLRGPTRIDWPTKPGWTARRHEPALCALHS